VLAANLDFSGPIRPAWWVLATGLLMPAIALLRGARTTDRTPRAAPGAPRRTQVKTALTEPLSPSA